MRIRTGRVIWLTLPLAAWLASGCASESQREFSAPEEAVTSFVSAMRAGDHEELERILGDESDDLLSSGDEVQDANARETFIKAYDAKHAVTPGEAGEKVLVVGQDDWPLPIPIVQDPESKAWRFDTEAGRDEIINRRIGENELAAISVCRAIIDAQHEYAASDPDGNGAADYAQKFLSDAGGASKKNGLYWKAAEGEQQSPLGELVTAASAEGYTHGEAGEPQPYHGYFYRILTAQGTNASGGARDYVVGGKLTGGVAVIAFPAEYANSGVMTFIAKLDGVVYEQDLGEATTRLGKEMKAFDPDPAWKIVEEE